MKCDFVLNDTCVLVAIEGEMSLIFLEPVRRWQIRFGIVSNRRRKIRRFTKNAFAATHPATSKEWGFYGDLYKTVWTVCDDELGPSKFLGPYVVETAALESVNSFNLASVVFAPSQQS